MDLPKNFIIILPSSFFNAFLISENDGRCFGFDYRVHHHLSRGIHNNMLIAVHKGDSFRLAAGRSFNPYSTSRTKFDPNFMEETK